MARLGLQLSGALARLHAAGLGLGGRLDPAQVLLDAHMDPLLWDVQNMTATAAEPRRSARQAARGGAFGLDLGAEEGRRGGRAAAVEPPACAPADVHQLGVLLLTLLLTLGDAAGQAPLTLTQIVADCLKNDGAQRPTAAAVRRQLWAMFEDALGVPLPLGG
jgi:hypothetical protein